MDNIQKAYSIFNTSNKDNISSIAISMKKLVGNHEISQIFFNSLFSIKKDDLDKIDVWKYWMHLLPIFNQNTNDQFKADILSDSIQKFKSLKQIKAEPINYQIISCWFSCLLNIYFMNSVQYSQIIHDIIKSDYLKLTDIVISIYLSLLISGKKIDSQTTPLTNCWFLYTFLKTKMNECSESVKGQIINLFKLRNYEWTRIDEFPTMSSNKIQKIIQPMKEIQEKLLDFIDKQDNLEENFQNFQLSFQENKIANDKHVFKLLFNFIVSISNNHYRESNFFAKIEKKY